MRAFYPALLIPLIACGPMFYQAPPSIGEYPERIATKRWPKFLPASDVPKTQAQPLEEIYASVTQLPDAASRLKAIDSLLDQNRSGDYSARRANFLHELRELAEDAELFGKADEYIRWRMQHDGMALVLPLKNATALHPDGSALTRQELLFAELDRQIASSPAELLPYWQVRKAAILRVTGNPAAAAVDFAQLANGPRNHPRTEVANLMAGVSYLNHARLIEKNAMAQDAQLDSEPAIDLIRTAAENSFTDYLARYPQGRFAADAEGWLGGISLDRKQYGKAVQRQVVRLQRQPSREVTATALRECEMIFNTVIRNSAGDEIPTELDSVNRFDAKAVSSHPLVTRLFLQCCLDPFHQSGDRILFEDTSGDRDTIRYLKHRILSPKPFVRSALDALGRELTAEGKTADTTTLVLLAWTATEEGHHEQALQLLDKIPETQIEDEALQARGIILQRLDRHPEAAATFEKLASQFPKSAHSDDIPFRRAVSLFKAGDPAGCVIELLPLIYRTNQWKLRNDEAYEGPAEELHLHSELKQWLDTVVIFSPLDAMSAALARAPEDSIGKNHLRTAIVAKALSEKRFDIAKTHLLPADSFSGREAQNSPIAYRRAPMDSESWLVWAAPLDELYQELQTASEADKPSIHLDIARRWMVARGHLTMPASRALEYADSEVESQDLLRRANALELDFTIEHANRTLDSLDEATHALEHAMIAAKTGDPTIAAAALELANHSLFRRQEFSLYANQRAQEREDSNLSKEIHDRLIRDYPDSPQAARSCYHVFRVHEGEWMPGDFRSGESLRLATLDLFPDLFPDPAADEKISALLRPLDRLPRDTNFAQILKTLNIAANRAQQIRKNIHPSSQFAAVRMIDQIDDLKAAASLPGIQPTDFFDYLAGRHENLPASFNSLLAFRALAGNPDPYLADSDIDETWRNFLTKYPDSPKSEAASLRCVRLMTRRLCGRAEIRAVHFPDSPIAAGYKQVKRMNRQAGHATDAVFKEIERHERRFPRGRYQDDINLLKAAALADSGDPRAALTIIEGILNNPAQRDLQMVATVEMMGIAQQLLVPEQRLAAANAFRSNPGAIDHLQRLVEGQTFLSRLKPMMPWLSSRE